MSTKTLGVQRSKIGIKAPKNRALSRAEKGAFQVACIEQIREYCIE